MSAHQNNVGINQNDDDDDEDDDALLLTDDAESRSAARKVTKAGGGAAAGGDDGNDANGKDENLNTYPRRLRLQATAAYCIAMVGLGFTMSALGPTIPTLAIRYGLSGGTALAPLLIMRGVG